MDRNSMNKTIKSLQKALNSKGDKILCITNQFYMVNQSRPCTLYCVKRAVLDKKTGKCNNIQLFQSSSQIQVVLFLRDLWYELNGWELPQDNEIWNELREKSKGKDYGKYRNED